MPNIKISGLKNRLYITLRDWDQADMLAYVEKIESACKALASGFTCLLVLQKNGLIRQKDKDLLFNTTDLISAYGASKVAYVRKTNGNPRMSRLSPLNFQTFIPVEHALTIKEAEDILDGKAPEIRSSKTFQLQQTRETLWRELILLDRLLKSYRPICAAQSSSNQLKL